MGRWLPDARGRLVGAAIELYEERGFEQTTAADIAERAGVTERTYFRHFADKREVLFAGSERLLQEVVAAAHAAAEAAPVEVAVGAIQAGATFLELDRGYAARRLGVIEANASLMERELLKMSTLARALAGALRERGVDASTAGLAAETAVMVFSVGFQRWVRDGSTDLAGSIRSAYEQLRALTSLDS
jgi:AcrR family transcriptional regulator